MAEPIGFLTGEGLTPADREKIAREQAAASAEGEIYKGQSFYTWLRNASFLELLAAGQGDLKVALDYARQRGFPLQFPASEREREIVQEIANRLARESTRIGNVVISGPTTIDLTTGRVLLTGGQGKPGQPIDGSGQPFVGFIQDPLPAKPGGVDGSANPPAFPGTPDRPVGILDNNQIPPNVIGPGLDPANVPKVIAKDDVTS